MSGNDPDHERVCEIFHEVADLEGDERERRLQELCGGDPGLRAKVAALLASDALDADPLETGAFLRPKAVALTDLEGSEIGPYRILERLGEGGMGVVYRAEQQRPVRRNVALKLLNQIVAAPETIERFEVEGQLLASMNHPNIAHVFDVGTVESGQPYFAMEFVDGAPITDFCDAQRLSEEQRLRLFLQVCDGVEHAHRKGVVHRDLKPSNILVASFDGKPLAKVIDFGVAKPLDPSLVDNQLKTLGGARVGTPAYMSPEQAATDGVIGPRTDIYSLGVVLHELLAGPRPSELDWITMRATAEEPELRYGSAAELADDIKRHLEGKPVLAGPPSFWYRARKFLARQRAAVAVVLSLLLVSVVLVVAVQLRSSQMSEQRDRRLQVALLQEIADAERSIRPVELLDQVAVKIDGSTLTGEEQRADLLQALGASYRNIGELDLALPRLQQAAEAYEAAFGPGHETSIRSAMIWANAVRAKGHFPAAVSVWRHALARATESLGASHPRTVEAAQGLANTYIALGRWAEAEALHRRALEVWTATLDPDHRQLLSSRNRVAELLILQGRLDEAETLLADLSSRRQRLGDRKASTLGGVQRLAMLRLAQGRLDEAELLCRERLRLIGELFRDKLLDRSPMMLEQARRDLAKVLSRQGNHAEAQELILSSIDALRKTLRESHPQLLIAKAELADARRAAGEPEAAAALYREVLGDWSEAVAASEPVVLRLRNAIGTLAVELGRYGEAKAEFRAVLAAAGESSPDREREQSVAREQLEGLRAT